MTIRPQLRQDIVAFLSPLQFFDGPTSRKAILLLARLDTLLPGIELTGAPTEFVTLLVDRLAQYGQIDDEQPALISLLEAVAAQIGKDRRQTLNAFCDQFRAQVETVQRALKTCPYQGLSAFQEADARFFFGRDACIARLLDAMQQAPLVAVLGASGSGKSSLVYAGVIPKLRSNTPPVSGSWRIAVFRPGEQPLNALATALLPLVTPGLSDIDQMAEGKKLAGYFERGELTLTDTLAKIRARHAETRLLLFIDQFEELYTGSKNELVQRVFIANLLDAVKAQPGQISVLLTLRSDFLGQTHSHPELSHAIAEHGVIVPAMNEAELRDAITQPAVEAGQPLDAATVALLIEQTEGREGALPLLQFALTKIWAGLAEGIAPAETLERIGGVGGALAGEAQRLYDRLSAAEQAIARRAFLAMIRLGEGTQDTRRRATLTEIVAYGEEPAAVHKVVQMFAQPGARLLMLSANPDGSETTEVSHEALLDNWNMLKTWLDANRDNLRFHRRLAEASAHWQQQGLPEGLLWRSPDLELLRDFAARCRSDMTPAQVAFFEVSERKARHAKQIKRLTVTAITILAILAICAAGAAFWAYTQANAQRAEVERRYGVSIVQSLIAYAHQDNAQDERERAALLVRHAYLLNQQYHGDVQRQIEDALHAIFRTEAIIEESGNSTLIEQVCDKVAFKTALTIEEWEHLAGSDIPYEPACPALSKADCLYLRSTPMNTTDMQALSLNLNKNGRPIRYIDNDFIMQEDVIISYTTGLMWQKRGLLKALTHHEAWQYAETLNREKFAGYSDWRLPTISELISLIEQETQSNRVYLNPMFNIPSNGYPWYWSADLYEKENGNPSRSAWYVDFVNGEVVLNTLYGGRYTRCVCSWQ